MKGGTIRRRPGVASPAELLAAARGFGVMTIDKEPGEEKEPQDKQKCTDAT